MPKIAINFIDNLRQYDNNKKLDFGYDTAQPISIALANIKHYSCRTYLLWVLVFFIAASTMLLSVKQAIANPEGGNVVAGDVNIHTNGNRLDIVQGSNKAIIDWQGFSINRAEHTHFNQPSTSAITLNRVQGNNHSQINGRLSANGQVFLVNPNGVVFGKDAQVSLGGLVATTSDIPNTDFLSGNYNFTKPSTNPNASIDNFGEIIVDEGGSVVLAAPTVNNEGLIQARLGRVELAGTHSFAVDFEGDGLLSFEVGEIGSNAYAVGNKGLISNSGTISADGGIVTLTARTEDALIGRVINMDGIIQAQAVDVQGGTIILSGGDQGIVDVSGTLDVSATGNGQTGGNIKILGEKVGLFDGTKILADGYAGGGEVLVGGNFQGKGPELNAQRTYVAENAKISASATETGDGGRVIVWADETTQYYGNIRALGGVKKGDGGFVEVSGKQNLDFQGGVSLSATNGNKGTVVLDPNNITILETQPQENDGVVAPNDGVINFADIDFNFNDDLDFELSNDVLEAIDGNVVLEATENIIVDAELNFVNQTTDETVDFRAGKDIQINADVTTNGASIGLMADSPDPNDPSKVPDGVGNIVIRDASISTNGGTLFMSGGTIMSGNITLQSGGGTIAIREGINGDGLGGILNLTLLAATGQVNLDDVGIGVALGQLNVNASEINLDDVFTTGTQQYSGNLGLGGTYDTGGGDFIVIGDTDVFVDTTVLTQGGEIRFEGRVGPNPDSGNEQLVLDAGLGGPVNLLGAVGSPAPLGELIVIGFPINVTEVSTIMTSISGTPSNGNQQYTGSVSLNNNYNTGGGNFTVNGDTSLSSDTTVTTTGGDIQFDNIEGVLTNNLVLNADTSGSILTGALININNLSVVQSSSTTFLDSVSVETINLIDTVNTIIFDGPLTTTNLLTTIEDYQVQFNQGGVINNTASTGFINTGGVFIGDNPADSMLFVGGLDTDSINLAGEIASAGSEIDIRTLNLSAASSLDSTNGGISSGIDIILGLVASNNNTITLNAGLVGNVDAQNPANDFSTVNGTANNISLVDINSIDLGASTINGEYIVVSADNITSSGPLSVAGEGLFSAGGSISLTDPGNNFTGPISFPLSGDINIDLVNSGNLIIGESNLGNGSFNYSGGGIQQVGTIDAGNASFNVNNGSVLLNNPQNDFTGTLSLNVTGSENIEIADTNLLQLGASTINSNQFSVVAQDLNIIGPINTTGSGSLVLQAIDLSQTIGIGDGQGTFNLSQSDIDNISNGFSSITIGAPGATGQVIIENATFNDPLIIQADGLGASIRINENLTGADNASITLNGSGQTTTLNGNIITFGNAIVFNDAVQLISDSLLDTTNGGSVPGGDITFNGLLEGLSNSLTIRAGFLRNNENAPLSVASLFVDPSGDGAVVFGSIAGEGGRVAAIFVRGVRGDINFMINGCVMGIPCEGNEREPIPELPQRPIVPSRLIGELPLLILDEDVPTIWTLQKISLDPRDFRYSNLGNEELWWEKNIEKDGQKEKDSEASSILDD